MDFAEIITLITTAIVSIATAVGTSIGIIKKALKEEGKKQSIYVNSDDLCDAVFAITANDADFDVSFFDQIILTRTFPTSDAFKTALDKILFTTKMASISIGITQLKKLFADCDYDSSYMLLVSLALVQNKCRSNE